MTFIASDKEAKAIEDQKIAEEEEELARIVSSTSPKAEKRVNKHHQDIVEWKEKAEAAAKEEKEVVHEENQSVPRGKVHTCCRLHIVG